MIQPARAAHQIPRMEATETILPVIDGTATDLPDASKLANGPANAPANALTPPTSEDMDNHKIDDGSSDLSDLEDLDDDGDDIEPDHYYDGGKVPVFKPVCLFSPTCMLYINTTQPPLHH